MGYLHIDNLYKNQTILAFKECYALEKIHGTSAHVRWEWEGKKLHFHNGGEQRERFLGVFDIDALTQRFNEIFPNSNVTVYGEAYGGKQQGMSDTYGKETRFVAFDVKVNDIWVNVPNAYDIIEKLGLEFVWYVKIHTDLEALDAQRDAPSIQAKRNGIEEDKMREGIILRPLEEFTLSNGKRVIAKHKGDNFRETSTPRKVSPEKLKMMEDAKAIANEWVTEMRLNHVLDKLPQDIGMENMRDIIGAMVEDVYREGKDEIVESKATEKAIASRTAQLFKQKLQNQLR